MIDLKRKFFTYEFAGKTVTLEVSKLAEQANAAVLGTYGDTTVLATVVMSDKDKEIGYFPLNVEYEERFYAAGKILGSRFIRREGRPSDEAILAGRIIDRTIRPLFDHRVRRQIQVVITVLSVDEEQDLDFIALITASAALAISNVPWNGPVAGVKIAKKKDSGEIILNPKNSEAENMVYDAFVCGTEEKINMVEFEGYEAQEADALEGFRYAHEEVKKLITWQKKVVTEIGAKKETVILFDASDALKKKVREFLSDTLTKAIYVKERATRDKNVKELQENLKNSLQEEKWDEEDLKTLDSLLEAETDTLIHKKALEDNERPDGRKFDEVRELHSEVGLLKRTHGSALFVRGNTQALAVTTLGPPSSKQLVESLEFSGKKRFMLHYNFPPYSVGETGFFRGPGRREIGHGSLAGKAIKKLIPDEAEFPYTIRVVSEILSSNGSSSMATVCATSLSLMDAGVPIQGQVAGIAMGLILGEDGNYKILTDIQGPEDHYGDMDFKVAGTASGITAMQLDVKIKGLTLEIIEETLAQAKKARLHILKTLNKALPEPRKEISPHAPSLLTISIDPAKIGEVIGPGGKVINGIIERTGALSIDIEEDGRVFLSAEKKQAAEAALEEVKTIARTYEVGEMVEGKVVKILEFGAIVEIGPRKDGMVHVSELKDGFVKKVEDVVKVGDFVRAKIIKVDPEGRIGLSIKQA
jgi:polyribonucleotide nucleotidyltransferase